MRILLVEDDARMRVLVRRGLMEQGNQVESAGSGPEAIERAGATPVDLIVLDLMLPGFDGVEVVRRLRSQNIRTPVLMLTARDAPADVVRALDAGADDYLVKPFAFAVLLARLRALTRRGPALHDARLQVADLSLDPVARQVSRAGAAVALTRTEFNLLEYLMRQAGRVVTRHSVIERVWGGDRQVENNTLDAFVKSLRHKIDEGKQPRLIQTIRGVGYCLRVESEP
ncbi:MAG TPA: response regulator transcription factor [Vicinamibacterales bacterium]|nr:response regulator transcription factor [Vicinamibacterales bacterium]